MKYIYLLLFLLPITALGQKTIVTRVIDGDTFVITSNERVRMVGINAPEISDIFGQEAKEHLKSLIEGKEVELKPDHISKDRDRYSRLLRYVYLEDVDIDKKMISDGYAIAYLKYHFDKPDEYKSAQIEAENNSFGMWHKPMQKNEPSITTRNSKPTFFQIRSISTKMYVLGALLFILVCIGLFSYLRK